MPEINYSKLRDKCCYCFTDISKGIYVCECLLSFCDKHLKVHTDKSDCKDLFFVEKKDTITVKGENLTEDENKELCKRMEMIFKCKNYDEKVVFKEGEVDCLHLKERPEGRLRLGPLKDLKCSNCPIQKQLYVCVTCGSLGCGRVQFGSEGNGHAMEHYKTTGHEVYVLLQSITPEYVCDTFCYTCNDFVINPFCDRLLDCEDFAEPGAPLFDVPAEGETSEFLTTPSPFLGIKNAGNTCYISSILQLYGFVTIKRDVDVSQHFIVCEYQDPLHCLYCQTARILNEIKEKYNNKDSVEIKGPTGMNEPNNTTGTIEATGMESISILDFLNVIWNQIPMFTKNTQHDANEFLMIFTQHIREGEDKGVFPSVTKFFSFEVENSIWCDKCKKSVVRIETHNMLYVPFKKDVQSSLESYFKDCPAQCDCSGEMWISNKLCSLPDFFIVTVGRSLYQSERFVKITTGIGVDHVNLSPFVRKSKLSNFFCQGLKDRGFSTGEIHLALSGNNFEDLEGRIKDYAETHRTKTYYEIGGSIVHSGNSMDSGHYMWWVRDSNRIYLVNDRRITEDTVDILESSYIMVFE